MTSGLETGDGDCDEDSSTWLNSSGSKLSGFSGNAETSVSCLSVDKWTLSKLVADNTEGVRSAKSFKMRMQSKRAQNNN